MKNSECLALCIISILSGGCLHRADTWAPVDIEAKVVNMQNGAAIAGAQLYLQYLDIHFDGELDSLHPIAESDELGVISAYPAFLSGRWGDSLGLDGVTFCQIQLIADGFQEKTIVVEGSEVKMTDGYPHLDLGSLEMEPTKE